MISGTPLALQDPPLLAIAEAERHFLENEYNEYASSNANRAAFCRSAALIVSFELPYVIGFMEIKPALAILI